VPKVRPTLGTAEQEYLVTTKQRVELREIFLYTRDDAGIDAAIEAVIAASRRVRIEPPADSAVVDEACKLFGLTTSQFFGNDRFPEFCECRAVAALVLRWQKCSYPTIAKRIGWKDHTAALAAVRRAKDSEVLKAKADAVLAKLGEAKREAA
jgi:chromosomal replication initiation ATPase DnaA